jgi:hypothetical protein
MGTIIQYTVRLTCRDTECRECFSLLLLLLCVALKERLVKHELLVVVVILLYNQCIQMQRSFGSWESPITSAFITANQIKLLELGIDKNRDEVYWVEGRPTEGNDI